MFSLFNAVEFISVRILSGSGPYLIYVDWPILENITSGIDITKFSIFWLVSVAEQSGLNIALMETWKRDFIVRRSPLLIARPSI